MEPSVLVVHTFKVVMAFPFSAISSDFHKNEQDASDRAVGNGHHNRRHPLITVNKK
jgi:hypothetical protein